MTPLGIAAGAVGGVCRDPAAGLAERGPAGLVDAGAGRGEVALQVVGGAEGEVPLRVQRAVKVAITGFLQGGGPR